MSQAFDINNLTLPAAQYFLFIYSVHKKKLLLSSVERKFFDEKPLSYSIIKLPHLPLLYLMTQRVQYEICCL